MKEMNRNSKLRISKSRPSSASLLTALKSSGTFNEKDLQTIKSLLEESNKIEDTDSTKNDSNTIVNGTEENDEIREEEVDVSEVAKSMGQETIDMLSKAKMRYGRCHIRTLMCARSSTIRIRISDSNYKRSFRTHLLPLLLLRILSEHSVIFVSLIRFFVSYSHTVCFIPSLSTSLPLHISLFSSLLLFTIILFHYHSIFSAFIITVHVFKSLVPDLLFIFLLHFQSQLLYLLIFHCSFPLPFLLPFFLLFPAIFFSSFLRYTSDVEDVGRKWVLKFSLGLCRKYGNSFITVKK